MLQIENFQYSALQHVACCRSSRQSALKTKENLSRLIARFVAQDGVSTRTAENALLFAECKIAFHKQQVVRMCDEVVAVKVSTATVASRRIPCCWIFGHGFGRFVRQHDAVVYVSKRFRTALIAISAKHTPCPKALDMLRIVAQCAVMMQRTFAHRGLSVSILPFCTVD